MRITAIDHVQLSMPVGEEARAREFYVDILGLQQVPKPDASADRGGTWFENDAVKIHLGVESEFRPARKAHPAFIVEGMDELIAVLNSKGYPVTLAEPMPGIERVHVSDPFGNRIELMELQSAR